MESHPASNYSHTCIDAGVDWITATCKPEGDRVRFDQLSEAIIEGEREAGVAIKPASLRDYRGFRAGGIFAGRRRSDSLLVLTGSHAPPHWQSVARASTNVSRLDIQATVWTHGEQPALNVEYYQWATSQPKKRGRPSSYELKRKHPYGDTFYAGNRLSDYYGRCYDYATAHKTGLPRTIWRFEVELKRLVARGYSRALLAASDYRVLTEQLVHAWWDSRGLQPTWSLGDSPQSEGLLIDKRGGDTLAWFERCLSKTVASAIHRHGLPAVLDALGLSGVVMPLTERRLPHVPGNTTPTLHD